VGWVVFSLFLVPLVFFCFGPPNPTRQVNTCGLGKV
jgi:hypothetical protein